MEEEERMFRSERGEDPYGAAWTGGNHPTLPTQTSAHASAGQFQENGEQNNYCHAPICKDLIETYVIFH